MDESESDRVLTLREDQFGDEWIGYQLDTLERLRRLPLNASILAAGVAAAGVLFGTLVSDGFDRKLSRDRLEYFGQHPVAVEYANLKRTEQALLSARGTISGRGVDDSDVVQSSFKGALTNTWCALSSLRHDFPSETAGYDALEARGRGWQYNLYAERVAGVSLAAALGVFSLALVSGVRKHGTTLSMLDDIRDMDLGTASALFQQNPSYAVRFPGIEGVLIEYQEDKHGTECVEND